MAGECCYANDVVPAAASHPTADADEANAATGAGGAPNAQQGASSTISGSTAQPTLTKPGSKRTCRCWWVALAAVVVVAVVASR